MTCKSWWAQPRGEVPVLFQAGYIWIWSGAADPNNPVEVVIATWVDARLRHGSGCLVLVCFFFGPLTELGSLIRCMKLKKERAKEACVNRRGHRSGALMSTSTILCVFSIMWLLCKHCKWSWECWAECGSFKHFNGRASDSDLVSLWCLNFPLTNAITKWMQTFFLAHSRLWLTAFFCLKLVRV